MKISFLKFASLHQKWCITVGPKGSHSLCVCCIHQNVKLVLSAANLEKDYHDLLEMIVCDRDSKECMVHRCPSCPGIDNLVGFLRRSFLSNRMDNDTEGESSEEDINADDDDVITIVLGDFSENYKFLFQDEVQGYHWNKQ